MSSLPLPPHQDHSPPLLTLPSFTGQILDSWSEHESRLRGWLSIHAIHLNHDAQLDFLLLSLAPRSAPLVWFLRQPPRLRASFPDALALLRARYASALRADMRQRAAQNALLVRTFRDAEHKLEMVSELINELDRLLELAGVHDDAHKRHCLIRSFRAFVGALKTMNRSTSYDGAVMAALTWESNVIAKAQEALLHASSENHPSSALHKHTKSRSALPKSELQPCPPPEAVRQHHPDKSSPELSPSETPQAPQKILASSTPSNDSNDDPFHSKPRLNSPPKSSVSPEPHKDHLHHTFQNWPQSHNYTDHQPNPSIPSLAQEKDAHKHSTFKDGSDKDAMAESFVDPHLTAQRIPGDALDTNRKHLADQFPQQQQQQHQNDLGASTWPPYEGHPPEPSTSYAFKPLVYDPNKNPYPPPQSPPPSTNQKPSMQALSDFARPAVAQQPNFSRSAEWIKAQNAERAQLKWPLHPYQISSQHTHPVYPPHSATIPFPVPSIPSAAAPPLPSGTEPSTTRDQPISYPIPMITHPADAYAPTPALDSQSIMDKNPDYNKATTTSVLPKRTSKLTKLPRRPSQSSQASSNRSSSSLTRGVKSFFNNLSNRRVSRESASASLSTQQDIPGPRTPSSIAPGELVDGGFNKSPVNRSNAGYDNNNVDVDGGVTRRAKRPMQVQFSKLFRKHNHSEALRLQQRSMIINRNLPTCQQPIKGKGRSLDFGRRAALHVRQDSNNHLEGGNNDGDEILGMKNGQIGKLG